MSAQEFMRAFKIHCLQYGLPQYCVSDLGTELVAGANIVQSFFNDPQSKQFFEEKVVESIRFDQFFKGQSQLCSIVESCIKMVNKLIYSSIKTNILSYRDYELLIYNMIHIVNRRPVAFKEALKDGDIDVPEAITPELITRGYQLVSINTLPQLQGRWNLIQTLILINLFLP
jgi:hypothetical protein